MINSYQFQELILRKEKKIVGCDGTASSPGRFCWTTTRWRPAVKRRKGSVVGPSINLEPETNVQTKIISRSITRTDLPLRKKKERNFWKEFLKGVCRLRLYCRGMFLFSVSLWKIFVQKLKFFLIFYYSSNYSIIFILIFI